MRQRIGYEPITGIFRWSDDVSNGLAGKVAGYKNVNGYIHIKVFGATYRAHRLAWFWMTGTWPDGDIDHRDGDKVNNRWGNLRMASRAENNSNRKSVRGSSSKYLGVYYYKGTDRWRARIRRHGAKISLGDFADEREAAIAYDSAAIEAHGEFARLNFPVRARVET